MGPRSRGIHTRHKDSCGTCSIPLWPRRERRSVCSLRISPLIATVIADRTSSNHGVDIARVQAFAARTIQHRNLSPRPSNCQQKSCDSEDDQVLHPFFHAQIPTAIRSSANPVTSRRTISGSMSLYKTFKKKGPAVNRASEGFGVSGIYAAERLYESR